MPTPTPLVSERAGDLRLGEGETQEQFREIMANLKLP